MAFTYKPWELFRPADTPTIEVSEVGRERHKIVVVDGVYANAQRIRELILATPAPIFLKAPRQPKKNFVDYFDCRQLFITAYEDIQLAAYDLVSRVYDEGSLSWQTTEEFSTNYFLSKNDPANGAQPHPHEDYAGGKRRYSCVVYFNLPHECRGGTAFYRYKPLDIESVSTTDRAAFERVSNELIEGHDGHNRVTGDGYFNDRLADYWERTAVVPMKFNRMLIFPAHVFHGALQEPGTFRKHPRINQVFWLT